VSIPHWAQKDFLWPAPAKINLFLHIVGRRPDGYHLLQTTFQFLDFCDQIEISLRGDGQIRRASDLPGVPEQEDLVVRAAQALQKSTKSPMGAEIRVHKNLPMGGGLGGGSSDAATTLVALNQLWQTGLDRRQLAEIGLALGADVPIFVHGQAAWAEGVGEQFQAISPHESWYLLVIPPVSVNTGGIFSSPGLTRDCTPLKIRDFLAGVKTSNVCEPLVREMYPEVDRVLSKLSEFGSPRMTGTGACVFLPLPSRDEAEAVLKQIPQTWQAKVCKGQNISPLYKALEE